MTKAAVCVACTDIVAPYRNWAVNRDWRWCQCTHTGVRWRDGVRGLLEVASLHGPDGVRVLGLNNTFFAASFDAKTAGMPDEAWRSLHDVSSSTVEPFYLFHEDRRSCWALLIRVGESGDVFFVPDVFPERAVGS